jgi:hypothetical protein
MGLQLDSVRNVMVHYGPRTTTGKFGREVPTEGLLNQAVYVFSYDDLPANGATNLQLSIPAYAKIKSASFEVLTGFAGGTAYTVGLNKADGTVVDADGVATAANLALANINARGASVNCTGAMVNVGSVGADPVEVVVTASGTFTAGKARLVIEWEREGN